MADVDLGVFHFPLDPATGHLAYAMEVGAENFSKQYPVKAPFILRLHKKITLRIKRSPGNNLDFIITHDKNIRKVIAKKTKDLKWASGFTMDINGIIKLCERISLKRWISVFCRGDILLNLKGNPQKMLKYFICMVFNRDILSISFWVLLYILSHLCKDFATLILSPLSPALINKNHKTNIVPPE